MPNSAVKSRPRIAVIIPAFNSEETLEPCLFAIEHQSVPPDELIVVNDGSSDRTALIAEQHATRVVHQPRNRGVAYARLAGIDHSTAELCVFIDSDIIIPPGALERIRTLFLEEPAAVAVTGRLAAVPEAPDFASDYKNLYMHFTFGEIGSRARFLFGSIFAVRRAEVGELLRSCSLAERGLPGEDDALGLAATDDGASIRFSRELQVEHLKRYSLPSLLKNDFVVPYRWGLLFWQYNGWNELISSRRGFLHASNRLLIALLLAGAAVLAVMLDLSREGAPHAVGATGAGWLLLNAPFFWFLKKSRGVTFLVKAIPFTFLDQLVMLAGAGAGAAAAAAQAARVRVSKAAEGTMRWMASLASDETLP